MSELLMNPAERKLWYDGPNYAADAVIIDPETLQILLIERGDTGEWALPGGFIDPTGESSLDAAVREAEEEAGLKLVGGGALVYRGKVNDPRNSEASWIETSAHMFSVSSLTPIQHGDDAKGAAWHNLASLPALYGSHQLLIDCALDQIDGAQLFDVVHSADSNHPVQGGYMQYDKWIAERNGEQAFVKSSPKDNPRFNELQRYIEKEAGIMSHLRRHGFRHLPDKSALLDNAFVMDALDPEHGWRWGADREIVARYLPEVLAAFKELETIPVPSNTFNVEGSLESILHEGWELFDERTHQAVSEKCIAALPQLDCSQQELAAALVEDIPNLFRQVHDLPEPEQLVFCHHDIRHSNFSWHPEKGVKIIDWSWAGPGLPGTDGTGLLIDLNKNGYDVHNYTEHISAEHCLRMIGFWLRRSTLPNYGLEGLREQQFISALNAYELLQLVSNDSRV